jgi:hypothetical protein
MDTIPSLTKEIFHNQGSFSLPFFVRNCPNDHVLSFHPSTKERTKENPLPLGYSNFWAKVPALKIFLSKPLRRLKQNKNHQKAAQSLRVHSGFIRTAKNLT